jgi:hypothetical protein
MIRGDVRHASGRETSFGRRLRMGAAGTMAIGGAIFMGGAATLVTASANTGNVSATQDCFTWSVKAHLDGNVANRLVTVTFPDAATTVVSGLFTTTTTGPKDIFSTGGAAPASGAIHEIIYNGTTVASGIDQQYNAVLPPPANCASAIRTSPSAGGVVGTAIHDSATVTGTLGSPAGAVVFVAFPPSNPTCSAGGTPAAFTSAPIALTSTTPGISTATSPSFPATAVGTYHWVATYGGSSIYKIATSNCADEAATIAQGAPSISTTAGSGGTVPVDVTDTATVSGGVNPTGSVTFTLYPSAADCTAGTNAVSTPSTVTLSGGKATSGPVHLIAAGTYQWLAKYNGDANNASVSSKCGDEPVIATSPSPSPSPSPTPPGGVQGITTPSTGDTGSLTGVTIGGFLLLGGLGVALGGSIIPRRRRRSAP